MKQDKGVYLIIINISDVDITVGALGRIHFDGVYVYVGSAQKNMQSRIKRHCSKDKKIKWHVDYISTAGEVDGVFVKTGAPKDRECKTASMLAETGAPVKGFGCSDCRCRSHLFKIPEMFDLENTLTEWGFKRVC